MSILGGKSGRATVSAWQPNGGRGQVVVAFSEPPPAHVLSSLRNVLDSQGFESQRGVVFKFWTSNSHVSETKLNLARMALHRSGYQFEAGAFPDAESADDCFGCEDPGSPYARNAEQ